MLTPEQLQVGKKLRVTDHFGDVHIGTIVRVLSEDPFASGHAVELDDYPGPEFYVGRFCGTCFRMIEPYEEEFGALSKMRAWAYEGIPTGATAEQAQAIRRLNGILAKVRCSDQIKLFGFLPNDVGGYYARIEFPGKDGAKRHECFVLTAEQCALSDDELRDLIEKTITEMSKC